MDIKPDFIGTEEAMITNDGVFPLPEAWKECVGLDVDEYWKQQDRERRRQAQLEKCELDEEDDGSHEVTEEAHAWHDRLMFPNE
jgi:hypothetical protein